MINAILGGSGDGGDDDDDDSDSTDDPDTALFELDAATSNRVCHRR